MILRYALTVTSYENGAEDGIRSLFVPILHFPSASVILLTSPTPMGRIDVVGGPTGVDALFGDEDKSRIIDFKDVLFEDNEHLGTYILDLELLASLIERAVEELQ